MSAKLPQSCPTLCDPMDCSAPGSSVHGILQARILEQVAMPSSRGSSQPRDQTSVSYIAEMAKWVLYCLAPPGKPPAQSRWTVNPVSVIPSKGEWTTPGTSLLPSRNQLCQGDTDSKVYTDLQVESLHRAISG